MQPIVSILLCTIILPTLMVVGSLDNGADNTEDGEGLGHAGGCESCHHPHRPTGQVARWRTPAERPGPFSLYRTRPGLPGRTSLLCLGCHDGAVAPEVHLRPRSRRTSPLGRSVLGIDDRVRFPLRSHPVGIKYPRRSKALVPLARVDADDEIQLPGGRVECISCHDPHGTEGHASLLVKSNRRSRLCLSCHRL